MAATQAKKSAMECVRKVLKVTARLLKKMLPSSQLTRCREKNTKIVVNEGNLKRKKLRLKKLPLGYFQNCCVLKCRCVDLKKNVDVLPFPKILFTLETV